MIYSKTITSVALSALLLMGMTGCSDSGTSYIPIEIPAPDAPVVDPAPVADSSGTGLCVLGE